ncbi:MAG: PH domain-containing protein [Pseudomonadota bacterium]|nr:PH domain-containing protein [Pseudomonadota bacterium]
MTSIADERLICRTRAHWIYFVPKFLICIAITALFAFQPESKYAVIGWLTGGAVSLLLIISYLNLQLTVTTRRVVKRHGWLWTEKKTIMVNKLEGIDTKRGVLDWIFGTATLVFTGTGSKPIVMPYVGKHEDMQELIAQSTTAA